MFPSPFDSTSTSPNFPTSDLPQNPNFTDPQFLFNLPTPLFFDEDHDLPLNQIFFQNHLMPSDHAGKDYTAAPAAKEESAKSNKTKDNRPLPAVVPGIVRRRNLGVVPRRKAGKKDRHSKICTAQGIRDRRMRLSLQVARKFFDLQDMLGYDKASKTIEWLFTKSKKAIKELTRSCDISNKAASNGEEFVTSESNEEVGVVNLLPDLSPVDQNLGTMDVTKSQNKSSREKARERARSRAKEKMVIKHLEEESTNPTFQKLGFSDIHFDGNIDQQTNPQNRERVCPSYTSHELSDLGNIEKLMGSSSSSMSSLIPISNDYFCSSYLDPNGNLMGFSGNWDSIQYLLTNQVQLSENPNLIYLATTNFL